MSRGRMEAIVVDDQDPEMRGRVRLAIPDLFYDAKTGKVVPSPWCEAEGAGGRGSGLFDVPEVGAACWVSVVESSDGDVHRLVYRRGKHGSSEDGPYAPAVARGVDDASVALKVSAPFTLPRADTALGIPNAKSTRAVPLPPRRPAVGGNDEISMLGSANAAEHPRNKVLATAGGFVVEVDDTKGEERLQVHHPSGASWEITQAGVVTERSSKRWEDVLETVTQHVGGDLRRRVDGNAQSAVGGNHVESATGRRVILAGELDVSTRFQMLMEVGGEFRQRVSGSMNTRVNGDVRVTSGGRASLQAAGNLLLGSGLASVKVSATQQFACTTLLGAVFSGPVGLDVTPFGQPGQPVALYPALAVILEILANHVHPTTTGPSGVSLELEAAVHAGTAAVASPFLRAAGAAGV